MENEIWENPNQGLVFVWKYDTSGHLQHVPVRPSSKVTLTIEERQINQEKAYSTEGDLFMNGALTPVKLIEAAEDYVDLATNPNNVSESDMKDLFKLKTVAFKAKLEDISNAVVIERMKQLAEDDEVSATMTQVKALDKRLTELLPKRQIEVNDIEIDKI